MLKIKTYMRLKSLKTMMLAKILNLLIMLGFVFIIISSAQDSQSSKLACTNISESEYHFYKAMYLLKGYQYGLEVRDCLQKTYAEIDLLTPLARTESGIEEIKKISLDHSQLNMTNIDLSLLIAAAKINLSNLYFEKDEIGKYEESIKEAGDIYVSLYPKEPESAKSKELITKIVIGLIRCSRQADALRGISKLPLNDPDRMYLSAEMYFATGNRKMAAEKYERWIALDCKSDVWMILNDDYTQKWTLLLSDNPDLTRCEQLPAELRARFETLKEQFNHPNNIPTRNFPGILYSDTRH